MPTHFKHLTFCGISLYVASGPRLVDPTNGALAAITHTSGSLCIYLGPFHMILDRS